MKYKENQAIARGLDLPISTKFSVDICSFLRGKTVERSRRELMEVLEKKQAIPLNKHKQDIPHRRGKMAAGRYPQKATQHILKIVNLAERNAHNRGLNTENLIIRSIKADGAGKPNRTGRHGRRQMKRTHIEVIVEEIAKKGKK